MLNEQECHAAKMSEQFLQRRVAGVACYTSIYESESTPTPDLSLKVV